MSEVLSMDDYIDRHPEWIIRIATVGLFRHQARIYTFPDLKGRPFPKDLFRDQNVRLEP